MGVSWLQMHTRCLSMMQAAMVTGRTLSPTAPPAPLASCGVAHSSGPGLDPGHTRSLGLLCGAGAVGLSSQTFELCTCPVVKQPYWGQNSSPCRVTRRVTACTWLFALSILLLWSFSHSFWWLSSIPPCAVLGAGVDAHSFSSVSLGVGSLVYTPRNAGAVELCVSLWGCCAPNLPGVHAEYVTWAFRGQKLRLPLFSVGWG